ncbi:MAG: hypothetical protein HC906_19300, partial [Bacteroidales bacterium]|nr:hypothetical protein [Bacteroidales bacterium]
MLNKTTIRFKIIIAFLALILITAGIGVTGYLGMHLSNTIIQDISLVRLPGVKALMEISEGQAMCFAAERGLINRRMMDSATRSAQYQMSAENM